MREGNALPKINNDTVVKRIIKGMIIAAGFIFILKNGMPTASRLHFFRLTDAR